mmetsp:Transcript_25312/g.59253  ORF Transcript_25312/g.59253 Transcript_25312/m.59253 type:complete len:423 (+) Transcript_25312:44-1312(+)
MDFLASLNLEDLPEQQTRIPKIFYSNPDVDLKLGFDACCSCGKVSTKIVQCPSCRRVKYCSEKCRLADSNQIPIEEGEQALGHTAIICSLLGLCNDDDAIDEGNKKELASFSDERRTAALDRVVSEFESYPATLANVIMEGPCFQKALEKSTGSRLIIHVIGSSKDVELWGEHPDKSQQRDVFRCYADALAEISERFRMNSIDLQFFGPECPKESVNETIRISSITGKKLPTKIRITTSNSDYDGTITNDYQHSPDILIFFNPGFTCPDYNWEKTLLSCMKDRRMPFLVTTNTEMEAMADMQHLFQRGFFQDIPPTLKYMLENPSGGSDSVEDEIPLVDDDDDDENSSFFSLNPYCGLRVRQSGTMANDLFVKSRWIFGGFTGPKLEALPKVPASKASRAKRKRGVVDGGTTNTKRSNPALV